MFSVGTGKLVRIWWALKAAQILPATQLPISPLDLAKAVFLWNVTPVVVHVLSISVYLVVCFFMYLKLSTAQIIYFAEYWCYGCQTDVELMFVTYPSTFRDGLRKYAKRLRIYSFQAKIWTRDHRNTKWRNPTATQLKIYFKKFYSNSLYAEICLMHFLLRTVRIKVMLYRHYVLALSKNTALGRSKKNTGRILSE